MYRKKDAKQNIEFCGPSQWPEHVISLHKKLIDEESDEIDKKSKDKDVCKVNILMKRSSHQFVMTNRTECTIKDILVIYTCRLFIFRLACS